MAPLGLRLVHRRVGAAEQRLGIVAVAREQACLLYTSDAADERSSVDLGGRRIIKKKKATRVIIRATNRIKTHNT